MEFCDSMKEEPKFQCYQRGASDWPIMNIKGGQQMPAAVQQSTSIKDLHLMHEITGALKHREPRPSDPSAVSAFAKGVVDDGSSRCILGRV